MQVLCYKLRTNFRAPSKDKYKKKVVIWKGMKIRELAQSLEMKPQDVMEAICRVLKAEQRLTYSTELSDVSLLSDVVKMCGGVIKLMEPKSEEVLIDKDVYRRNMLDHVERLKSRPPVVTIMGHVDHGKTTLLDSLRSSRVVDSEFGGITQHIGAFKVSLSNISGQKKSEKEGEKNQFVTFLDTPGHAAFSSMRSRGVNCTDIVVLVIAAEDGVMAQTEESISLAIEAEVPIIVAANKVDRIWKTMEELNKSSHQSRVFQSMKRNLASHGVDVDEYRGVRKFIPISALKKWNLDELQKSILKLADVIDIRADFEGNCEAVIIESNMADHLGKVATVLVQQGQLKVGSIFVAGDTYVRVRTIQSDKGDRIKYALPGDPVQITGWKSALPKAGDVMIEVKTESKANEVLEYRKRKKDKIKSDEDFECFEKSVADYRKSYKSFIETGHRRGIRFGKDKPKLEDFLNRDKMKNGVEIPQINIIVKTDVYGSLDAFQDVFETLSQSCSDQCTIKLVHGDVGHITDNDIDLAQTSKSIIYTFNLPNGQVQGLSEEIRKKLDIRYFNLLHELLDDLKKTVTEKLPKLTHRDVLGEGTVLKMFDIKEKSKVIPVCGTKCTDGHLYRNLEDCRYQILRPEKGSVESSSSSSRAPTVVIKSNLVCKNLRHLKTDVDSIRKGTECGITLVDENKAPFSAEVGDIVQCYKLVTKSQELIWNLGFQ